MTMAEERQWRIAEHHREACRCGDELVIFQSAEELPVWEGVRNGVVSAPIGSDTTAMVDVPTYSDGRLADVGSVWTDEGIDKTIMYFFVQYHAWLPGDQGSTQPEEARP
jgi:hypothetical protein